MGRGTVSLQCRTWRPLGQLLFPPWGRPVCERVGGSPRARRWVRPCGRLSRVGREKGSVVHHDGDGRTGRTCHARRRGQTGAGGSVSFRLRLSGGRSKSISPFPSQSRNLEGGQGVLGGEMVEEGINADAGLAAAPYDQWLLLGAEGSPPRPPARYKHAAEVVQDKLYVVGGSRNGRLLSDVQVFDFRTFTWSPLNPTRNSAQPNHESNSTGGSFPALAGHSLVKWKNNLMVVAGNTRSLSSSNKVSVWLIDVETNIWSAVDTYGTVPTARGGQSVSLLGSRLLMFGGEDNNRRLLNDLHILDLETMVWEEVKTEKGGPAPRYDHSAAVYADQYLLIFGGSSHSACFNDLYLLDLQTLEWSQPDTQGAHITPRSSHAGTMIDENWYIVGGGDNASGSTDTIVMNASKFVWSVVTSVSARDPLACEGLTLCSTTVNSEKFLVAFGGYNGKYSNEIFVLKLRARNLVQPRLLQSPAAAAAAASVTAAYAVITATDEKTRDIVATDDFDIKRAQPASCSKKFVAEIDALNGEKGKLESRLTEVHDENSKLKDKLDMANLSYNELAKELKSVQNQLAAEGSRCQKLESQIVAARKRLDSAGSLGNELEELRQQISQVEQTMATGQRQKSGGVWKWVAGSAEVSDDE